MLPPSLSGELVSGPALFVVLLSVVFLLVPCYYLFRSLQERGTLERFGIE